MDRIRFSGPAAFALAIAAVAPAQAFAQTEIVAQPNPDADRLAAEVRVIAENPRNIDALISAGDLSARLGDTAAALAFFARAETIDATNPRIAAGRARVLVRLERPGEALRLFALAEQRGVPVAEYALDRGLAYDLLGQPGLAQRDYRAALARGGEDEAVRRYALSLGITGRTEEAMAALDPLLRRRDRAAWRARAFVMAMGGDVPGAERIAASMMPGTMGQAMTPFFRRLATLSVADRAYAVHFGELRPTQARLADAQLAPALPAYVPEPRPVAVAAATPAPPPAAREPSNRDRRSRRDRQRVTQVAAVAPAPAPAPSEPPLPPPPSYEPVRVAEPTPIPAPGSLPAAPSRDAPVQLASRSIASARSEIVQPIPAPAPAPTPAPTPAPPPSEVRTASVGSPSAMGGGFVAPTPAPAPVMPTPAPVETATAPLPEPIVRQQVAEAPRPASAVGREDSTLAAIISDITIPASELGVAAMPGETAPPPSPPRPEPAPVRVAAAEPVAEKPKPAPAKPTAKPVAEPAKAKKKPEPAKPDPKKAEPSRIWVQVAGGANETTLSAAWKKLVARVPAAFKGRSPWTTPLRATNRVLAGPFKTSGEAQGFVNQLAKADISAFVFTSEAGQKITRLTVK